MSDFEKSMEIEDLNDGNPMLYFESPKTHWQEFACGWGAAFINITMLHGVGLSNACNQLQTEGLYFLYRGMLPPLCQKTLSLSIMFGVYEQVRYTLVQNSYNNYFAKTVGGMVSGSVEAILMPFERIQTLLADSKYHIKYKNTAHAFQKVMNKYGLPELYRGLTPILLRNGPSNVGFFILRDEVQIRLPKFENYVYKSLTEFICGAMIGVILSSIFYPLNVIKVSMQSNVGGEFTSIIPVLLNIYKTRGGHIKNIYHGCFTNCTRAFISWGVMNTAYENLKQIIY